MEILLISYSRLVPSPLCMRFIFPWHHRQSPTAYSNDARGKRVLRGVGTGPTKICQLQDTLSRQKIFSQLLKPSGNYKMQLKLTKVYNFVAPKLYAQITWWSRGNVAFPADIKKTFSKNLKLRCFHEYSHFFPIL